MRAWVHIRLVTLAAVLILGAGCSSASSSPARTAPRGNLTERAQYGGAYVGGTATGDTEAGAAFARWVLEQDPQRQYITDAVVRDEQALGVKVQPNITRGELQNLLTALTEGMARTFPGRPLQVTAFYQSGDRLAEAEYDPRSGRVDVRFAG
jgi:hypothetical protein